MINELIKRITDLEIRVKQLESRGDQSNLDSIFESEPEIELPKKSVMDELIEGRIKDGIDFMNSFNKKEIVTKKEDIDEDFWN